MARFTAVPDDLQAPARALSRQERLAEILRRDGGECVWCGRSLVGPDDSRRGRALVRATTDHLIPKLKGGPSWMENEVAACARCNRARGHRSPAAWLEDCERLGLTPNREVIVRCLSALGAAIEANGGQRRARPYLAAQLRRLTKP
ncbi:MAG: HNH endonuclease [Actinomycetota bacterium]